MFKKVVGLCDKFLQMGIPGYDVMICIDGKPVLRHWNGYADLEKTTPILPARSIMISTPAPS